MGDCISPGIAAFRFKVQVWPVPVRPMALISGPFCTVYSNCTGPFLRHHTRNKVERPWRMILLLFGGSLRGCIKFRQSPDVSALISNNTH